GFGPYTPGFRIVPYDVAQAVADAIDDTTVAVLVEPVQGEAGLLIPPAGYLPVLRPLTSEAGALPLLAELHSGLGRSGPSLAHEVAGVEADLTMLGKALGGGIVPSSGVVGRADVLGVLTAGTHGSTFGGNPVASAVGLAVTRLLATGEYQERARILHPIMSGRAGELLD